MRLPNTTGWLAGDQPNAEMFNDLSYSQNFLFDTPECFVTQAITQSVLHNTQTSISWSYLLKDNESGFGETPCWNISDPTKVYIRTPGWYEIEYGSHWTTAAANTSRFRWISINTADGYGEYLAVSSTDEESRGYIEQFLNRDDYLRLRVLQDSGSTLTTDVSLPVTRRFFLRAKWVSL